MVAAFCASTVCRQPYATVFRIATKLDGVVMITFWRIASSISDGISASAAEKNWSPGMNRMTKSGLFSNWFQ
jgi:hypothetical protein